MFRPNRFGSASRVAALLGVLVLLAGCSANDPNPIPSPSEPSPQTSVSAQPTEPAEPTEPRDPTLLEGGTALANKEYFDFVNERYLAENDKPRSRGIVNNLVEAGFAKEAMQVTSDRTPLGREVDSIEVSVQLHDECLIGQVGSSGYHSTIVPVTLDGLCLIGKTLTIDW